MTHNLYVIIQDEKERGEIPALFLLHGGANESNQMRSARLQGNLYFALGRHTSLFVNTSGMLNYGGYGETMGYKPASTDTPLIRLDGTRKRMTAAL